MVSKKTFTSPLKTNQLFPLNYSKFHYPCIQTHIFLKLTLSPPKSFLLHWIYALLNFHSLPSTLSPPKVFPLLKFYSSETLPSWSHGLLDVWRCGCGCWFDVWKSWFQIWFGFYLGLGIVSNLMFEVRVWLYLWGFSWFCEGLEIIKLECLVD